MVWIAIFALLVKMDVAGIGSTVLYPVLKEQSDELSRLLEMHLKATGSAKAREILEQFGVYLPKFKAVISDEYMNRIRK